jgi:two-component system sensor histidine kinase KdpD
LRENRTKLSLDEQDQLLETIFQQSRTMSSDVSDLLEMTRLHAGPIILNRQWHPVEELIGAALQRCKSTLAMHHVSIEIPADVPLVFVDGVLIEKLLVNLFENAAKYTLPGARISIAVTSSKEAIEVFVEDDGPGLPQGFEMQLFKKFSRAQTESAISGSGLGLSICRAIAHLHEMNLTGRNRPLGGAQFVLSIPYRVPPATLDGS